MPAKSERDIEPSAVPAPAASSRDANARDPVRLAALRETGLLDTSAEERFDRLTRLAARLVGVPSSFISLVDAERDYYKSAWGHNVPIAPQGSVSGRTLCHDVIQRREPLVISDTASDPTYRDSPIAREIGIGAYVGIPLIVNGEAIGAFCAMDVEARQWSTDDIEVLEALASAACREMERRSAHLIIDAATTALKSREQELLESNEQLQGVATELEAQTEELQATTMELEERAVELQAVARRARFAGAVGHAIISGNALPQVLQHCCEAAVDHLMAAFARVWLLNESEPVLVLTASAGMYTHLDGPHGRVPVGQFKIGKIAAERAPHLTNSVIGDPRIPAQEWAKKEGMVAFAGYPLIVAAEVVGVIAMFSRESLTDADFEALGTSATAISVTIRNAANFRAGDRARKSAEVANRSKADFLTVMSHELRTPLNAIGGYTEILELGVHGPINEAQKAALDRIQRSQRHLLGLINGILNFAKVDAGAVEYELERVLLSDVIASSEALIAPQARSKSLDLRIERDGVSPAVIADREKTQQILLNLLSNAIKFTDAGGTIGIRCGLSSDSSAEIRVTDSGRGIAEGELDRVFQPFVQIDATLTRTKEGTGLGLSISRDLARGMKGDLRAASELGKGSTFTLTLPLAPN